MAVGPKYLKYGILFRVFKLRPELLAVRSVFGEMLMLLESEFCEVVCGRRGRVSCGSMGGSGGREGALAETVLSLLGVFLPSFCASVVPVSSP